MTKQPKRKLWYDNYTKILHIGKIMMRIVTKWELYYCRIDGGKIPYLKIGRLAIRF